MKNWIRLLALSSLMALGAVAGCGDDDDDDKGTAGTSGAAGTTAGTSDGGKAGTGTAGTSAGTGGTTAGAAGTSAGTAGTSAGMAGMNMAGGAAGSTAGTGGTAGAGGAGGGDFQAFANCTFDKAVAATSTKIGPGLVYSTPCLKVKVGGTVTLPGETGHPLKGMTANGTQPNPIANNQTDGGFMSDQTITFASKGSFGFYCAFHGSDTASNSGMKGVVYAYTE